VTFSEHVLWISGRDDLAKKPRLQLAERILVSSNGWLLTLLEAQKFSF
jgi:hypothetical protein